MFRFLSPAAIAAMAIAGVAALPAPSAAVTGAAKPMPVITLPQRPELIRRGAHRSYAIRSWHGMKSMISFPTPIQHVVVIDMENRTVDNLFAALYGQPFRGGPQTWDQVMSIYNPANTTQPLTANGFEAAFDPHHGHDAGWLVETLQGFGAEKFGCGSKNDQASCPPNATAYSYVPAQETVAYQQIIQNYAFADNLYQANEGPSFVSHQYLIAAQSGGITGSLTAPFAESENPGNSDPPAQNSIELGDDPDGSGSPYCANGNSSLVGDLNMTGFQPEFSSSNKQIAPCETYGAGTILDEIGATMGTPSYLDWQFISHQSGGLWSAPTAVENLYNQWVLSPPATASFAVDPNAYNFVQSLRNNGNPQRPFAALTYITPCPNASDHASPSGKNVYGPAWITAVVNAIGTAQGGALWPKTAIIITWDDWGGWFDHSGYTGNPAVPWFEASPNPYANPKDPNEWGFRVPMMIISPYATARGYISHGPGGTIKPRSQTAIMTLVEYLFGLAPLGGDDSYANDPMLDMFEFSNPLPFIPITQSTNYSIPSTC